MKSVLTRRPKALLSALSAVTMLALGGLAWWARAPLLEGHGRLLVTQPERAAILDSQGTPLAWSTPELSVWIHLKAFASQKAAAPQEAPAALAKLASLLKIPPDQLSAQLAEPGEAAWLTRHAEVRLARDLQGLASWGVRVEQAQARHIRPGAALGRLIGLTDTQGQGIEGLESALQNTLAGRSGVERRLNLGWLGSVGIPVPSTRHVHDGHPQRGQDVRLWINLALQQTLSARLEALLKEQDGSQGAILLAQADGKVRAVASLPELDRTRRDASEPLAAGHGAFAQTWEPGTLLAPLVASASTTGPVGATQDTAPLPGGLHLPQVPAKALHDRLTSLGLGTRPAIEFPGAITGRLRPLAAWRETDHLWMHRGRGVSVTMVQLVQAYVRLIQGDRQATLSLLQQPGLMPLAPAPSAPQALGGRGWPASVHELLPSQALALPDGQQALVITDLNEGWREGITPRLSALAVFPADKPQWILAFTLMRPKERDAAAWVKRSRQFMKDSLRDLAGQQRAAR